MLEDRPRRRPATKPTSSWFAAGEASRSPAACAAQRGSERPDSTHGTTGSRTVGGAASTAPAAAAPASRMTCALVPLTPNDDTAARRGRSPTGHSRASRQQPHVASRPINERRRLRHMQRLRQDAVAHRQHHLDHTTHTSRRLSMTDVRLQRPQPQRRSPERPCPYVASNASASIGSPNRVPVPCASTTSTSDADKASTGQRLTNHPLLRRTIRRRQPIRRTVLIHRRTPHHRQHLMTVTPRVRQPLHHQHPHTLGPADAVGGRRERLAPPVRRQPALPTELDEQCPGST